MKKIKDIALVIQARLLSQRCPRKMVRPFANSTLLDIAIQKVLNSNVFLKENIYVTVHEQELIDIASKYNVHIFKRSKKSAMSEGSPMTELYEWWDKIPYKNVIKLNACCVLLDTKTIDSFAETYMKTNSRGLFGVIEKRNYIWNKNGDLITNRPDNKATMNTKKAGTIYEAGHCLYAGKMSDIGKGIWMGEFKKKNDPELYIVPEKETFDIDYEWQFNIAEILYKNKYKIV